MIRKRGYCCLMEHMSHLVDQPQGGGFADARESDLHIFRGRVRTNVHVKRFHRSCCPRLDAACARTQEITVIVDSMSQCSRQASEFIQSAEQLATTGVDRADRRRPPTGEFVPTLRAIGGAIRADADELARNPRARSAVLRVAERLP